MIFIVNISRYLYVIVLCFLLFNCCGISRNSAGSKDGDKQNDGLTYDEIWNVEEKNAIVIDEDVNLKGNKVLIPEGVTLVAGKGVIKNGTLIGNNTKIISTAPIFLDVHINGSWIVPKVSTSIFVNHNYENFLQDVIALTNKDIKNAVCIEEGDYYVTAQSFSSAIALKSNTHLTIDGNIHLTPNGHKGCYVININQCDNVIIDGSGCVIGDKSSHKGTEGQWGHGINILSSNNVKIEGLRVIDCWGDCIYVGNESRNVIIANCFLSNSRRQGVSVTSADGVIISNCDISNIAGSPPQYAIDIEPNENEYVNNIVIDHVTCKDCVGGITMWHPDHASIGSVTIRNCHISGTTAKRPVVLELADKVTFKDCYVEGNDKVAVSATRVNDLQMSGNTIITTNENPIAVIKCSKSNVKNNRINGE